MRFDGDPAVFRIQGLARLMPSLTQLAEIHVLDLCVAHHDDAASATARTHWRRMFDHSDETPAWESAFPAHWDRRNLNSHWVHRAIYISPARSERYFRDDVNDVMCAVLRIRTPNLET
jgi:hypothetical protein